MIKISSNAGEKIIYPALSNNKKRHKKNRFGVKLKYISMTELQLAGKTDDKFYNIKAHVQELINPPELTIDGGKKREMEISDIVKFPELSDLLDEIFSEIITLRYEVEMRKKKL